MHQNLWIKNVQHIKVSTSTTFMYSSNYFSIGWVNECHKLIFLQKHLFQSFHTFIALVSKYELCCFQKNYKLVMKKGIMQNSPIITLCEKWHSRVQKEHRLSYSSLVAFHNLFLHLWRNMIQRSESVIIKYKEIIKVTQSYLYYF